MTITTYDRTSSVVIDAGYKNSVRTPNYRNLVSEGKLLPVNLYQGRTFSGSTPAFNKPSTQGGTSLTYRGLVPLVDMDAFEIFVDSNNSGWSRVVTISNGSIPQPAGGKASSGAFRSIYGQGIDVQNKLVKKLNSRDIDLGVALGEARETAHFVQGAMLSTYRAYQFARRGDVSGMLKALGVSRTSRASKQSYRDVLDAASGVWLQYSYAVRPLLADVFGAMSALEKRLERPTMIERRARISSELDIAIATANGLPGSIEVEYSLKGELISKAGVVFQVDNPLLYTLSQVGLTNPLNVAWELVPFSFVVDWFTPIGAWFDGLVPPQGVSLVRGYSSYVGIFHGKGRLKGNYPVPPNKRDGAFEWPATWYNKFVGRNPMTNFPRYHLVGADFSLSKSQIASGLSLLWSVGAGRKAERSALKEAEKYHNLGTITTTASRTGQEHKAVDWSQRGGSSWRH